MYLKKVNSKGGLTIAEDEDSNELFYVYKYPQCSLTADIVIASASGDSFDVLLVERKFDPFKDCWALPGGFVDLNCEETPLEAASRELEEETGLEGIPLSSVGAFAGPHRDPRGYTCTFVFKAFVDRHKVNPKASDDAKSTAWFPVTALPKLAFDHSEILQSVFKQA